MKASKEKHFYLIHKAQDLELACCSLDISAVDYKYDTEIMMFCYKKYEDFIFINGFTFSPLGI